MLSSSSIFRQRRQQVRGLPKETRIKDAALTAVLTSNGAGNSLTVPLTGIAILGAFPKQAKNPRLVKGSIYSAYFIALFGVLDGFFEARDNETWQRFRNLFNAVNDGTSLWLFLNQFADEFYSAYLCNNIKNNQCYASNHVYWGIVCAVAMFGFATVAKSLLQEKYKDHPAFRVIKHILDSLLFGSILQVFPSSFIKFNESNAKEQTYWMVASVIGGLLPTAAKILRYPGELASEAALEIYENYEDKIEFSVDTISNAASLLYFAMYLINENYSLLPLVLLMLSATFGPAVYSWFMGPADLPAATTATNVSLGDNGSGFFSCCGNREERTSLLATPSTTPVYTSINP